MKKTMIALLGLVLMFALAAPQKASAQVAIGIGVSPYGYVAPAPYPYYACGYYPYYPCGYPYYGGIVVGGGWYGGGWGHGYYGYRGGGYRGGTEGVATAIGEVGTLRAMGVAEAAGTAASAVGTAEADDARNLS